MVLLLTGPTLQLLIYVAQHDTHAHTLRNQGRKRSYDLGLLGVMLHIAGDAFNTITVMIAAAVIWKTGFQRADALASFVVGVMTISTAWPLIKRSGRLLLEAAPRELDLEDVAKDIKSLKGILDLHEMHIFSLSESCYLL